MKIFNGFSSEIRGSILQTILVTGLISLFVYVSVDALSRQLIGSIETQSRASLRRIVTLSRQAIEPTIVQVRAGLITREQGLVEVTSLVRRMTYLDEDGPNYVFMSDYDGVTLVQPFEPEVEGSNRIDLQDENGKYIIRSLIDAARAAPEGDYVSYIYQAPHSRAPEEKVAFVIGIPELDAYVGTGMYMERTYARQRQVLINSRRVALGFIFLVTLGSLLYLLRINERQQLIEKESAVRQAAEQNLLTVFNNTYDAIIISADRRVYAVNDRMLVLFGVTRQHALQMTIDELSAPPDRQVSSADDVTERALAGEDVVFEWKIRRVSTGELVDCEVALRPIQWYGQQMILGVIRDISERKSTEAERQASRLYLEHSQTLAHVGHYSYDLRTRKLSWSRELLNIFGLDPDGPAPSLRDHRHLVPTAGYETMIQTLRKHASSLQPFGMEFEIRRADGQARVLDARIDWLRDAQGRATVQFGAIMDISEYKRAQEKIQTELEKLNGLREIDGFITNRYPLEETLKAVAGQAVRNLHVEAAWVMLSPAPGEPKRVVASAGQQQVDPISSEQIPAMFSQAPVIVCGEVQGVVMVKNPESVPQDVEWIDYLFSLAGQAAVAIDNARLFDGLQRTNLELQKAYDTAISGWSKALELRDKETQGHTDRIVRMAQDLALRVGLSEEELVHFRRGVYLHDIGKMGIPDSILLKTGPLTPEEWTVMRRHPEFAREWLEGNAYLAPALVIPYYHHERWNGSGYPCGLKGESIPLEARIFAVVDVWDALTHDRPYRAAELPEKVRAYLVENAGVQFDPRIVKAFLDILVETHHT